jgi:hypothetical protein
MTRRTRRFSVVHRVTTKNQCHADPFGEAQGMLREASRCNVVENDVELVRWFASLTMTWGFMGGARRIQWCFTAYCRCRIGEMVRSTHHDMGFHGWDTAYAAVFCGALCHTENPCHADRREASRCNAMQCNGGQRRIGAMVRFTHHDTGFHGWNMAYAAVFRGIVTLRIQRG